LRIKVIAHYHPAASLHQPRLWAVMLNDWENLPEEVPHDYVVVAWDKVLEFLVEQV